MLKEDDVARDGKPIFDDNPQYIARPRSIVTPGLHIQTRCDPSASSSHEQYACDGWVIVHYVIGLIVFGSFFAPAPFLSRYINIPPVAADSENLLSDAMKTGKIASDNILQAANCKLTRSWRM